MCGIAGVISFKDPNISIDLLKQMTDVIRHRGPDGEGQWVNEQKQVGFGHRRLSIIDLSENGKQPMHYANGRYTITFNGEVYNYVELKDSLVKQGYTFKSTSDTEVLMALYDLKKEKCLQELDGMFSFAIWDAKEQTLFCARDRFGEKPFYYYHIPGKVFYFASEMKQLWQIGIPKKQNKRQVALYTTYRLVQDPDAIENTFYEDIFSLPPANYLKINFATTKIEKINYWQLPAEPSLFTGTFTAAVERFNELFTLSIKRRLRSDVPNGSSLSGGLDSSAIVLNINRLNAGKIPQHTFSARFKGFIKDEGEYMEEVLKNGNFIPHFTYPDEEGFISNLEKLFYHQEEPFGSASIYAQYEVMKLARKNNVIVLLDGQGADEMLGGYLFYYHTYLNQLKRQGRKSFKQESAAYAEMHDLNYKYHPKTWRSSLRQKVGFMKRKMLGQPIYGQPSSFFSKAYVAGIDTSITQTSFSSLYSYLKSDTTKMNLAQLLRYADRNSMANSVEIRLPFLNHELVEFIFSLPDEFKLSNGWTKYVLRTAAAPYLPDKITWRKDKIGYEPPQTSWLKTANLQSLIATSKEQLADTVITDFTHVSDWNLLMLYFLNK